jgi:hypothetical protein
MTPSPQQPPIYTPGSLWNCLGHRVGSGDATGSRCRHSVVFTAVGIPNGVCRATMHALVKACGLRASIDAEKVEVREYEEERRHDGCNPSGDCEGTCTACTLTNGWMPTAAPWRRCNENSGASRRGDTMLVSCASPAVTCDVLAKELPPEWIGASC